MSAEVRAWPAVRLTTSFSPCRESGHSHTLTSTPLCRRTTTAQIVARGIVHGMERWQPYVATGFDGWMLSTLTAGMGPAGGAMTAAVQVATMGLWRLVAIVYVQYFYHVVARNDTTGRGWARPDGSDGGSAAAGTVYTPPAVAEAKPVAVAAGGSATGALQRKSSRSAQKT